MGVFNPSVITDIGKEFLNMAQHGSIKSLKFTKIVLSDMRPTGDLSTLTAIEGGKQSANIEYVTQNKTSYTVNISVSNENLTEGYYIRTIGLYAQDYPSGEEILFSVTTANEDVSTPDWMPPFSNAGVTSILLKLDTGISNTEIIYMTANPAGAVPIQQFTDFENSVFLSGDMTVYVAGGGEDENGNLYTEGGDISGDGTQEKPYKTIQKAVDMCPMNMAGYSYNIQLMQGVYDEEITISDKIGTIDIKGAENLEDSENFKIKYLNVRQSPFVRITGVKFTGRPLEVSNEGLSAHASAIYLSYCKFDDCILRANINSNISVNECDLSNYRSGTHEYGVIHANGGRITCYNVSGTNNKVGYGGGTNTSYGGDIYVKDNCTLEADTLMMDGIVGNVHYNTSRYTFIGSIVGNSNSIPIDPSLYTEFFVVQERENKVVTYHIISPLLTDEVVNIYGGNIRDNNVGCAGAIAVSNSSITQLTFIVNDTNVNNATLSVYAKR